MNARLVLCALAIASVATGPRSQEVSAGGRTFIAPCSATSTGNCYIDVVVVPGSTCEVTLANPAQEIVGVNAANFMLWRIVSPSKGWFFTSDGVSIHDNWQREFTNPKLTPDALGYIWKNRRTLRKTYKYGVTVTNADETIECTLDPWIKNQ